MLLDQMLLEGPTRQICRDVGITKPLEQHPTIADYEKKYATWQTFDPVDRGQLYLLIRGDWLG